MWWLYLVVGFVSAFFLLIGLNKNDEDVGSSLLKLPKAFFYIGVFLLLTWTALIIVCGILRYEPTLSYVIGMSFFGLWWLVSLAIVMAQKNWSIRFYEDRFVHTNFLGVKRQFFYRDIKRIKRLKTGDQSIKINKKFFPLIVDQYVENWNSFIKSYNKYKLSQRPQKQK